MQLQASAQVEQLAHPQSERTLENVPRTPSSAVFSPEEDKQLGMLLRKKVEVTGINVGLPVHTGGRPAVISYLPFAQEGSSTESRRSKGRREKALQAVEKVICGESSEDLQSQHTTFPV